MNIIIIRHNCATTKDTRQLSSILYTILYSLYIVYYSVLLLRRDESLESDGLKRLNVKGACTLCKGAGGALPTRSSFIT